MLNRSPLAVSRPWCWRPYHDARPTCVNVAFSTALICGGATGAGRLEICLYEPLQAMRQAAAIKTVACQCRSRLTCMACCDLRLRRRPALLGTARNAGGGQGDLEMS